MQTISELTERNDPELVNDARQGSREAFGALVMRHQAGACAVAYSICGDFAASEDIAQDAFVTGWKQLGDLREPGRFRSWICGIARNIALNQVRRSSRREERVANDLAAELPAPDLTPRERAVSAEESQLVWRTLDRLPSKYREPLVLFYREQHSIAAVAAALDLTEDTAKQRISRGRVMLREEMAQQLEGILGATRPSVTFTLSVLGALPPVLTATGVLAAASTSKAAASGTLTTAAKVSAGSAISVIAGAVLSSAVGLLGLYVGYKVWRSPCLSVSTRRILKQLALASAATWALLGGMIFSVGQHRADPVLFAGVSPATALVVAILSFLIVNFALAAKAARALFEAQDSAGSAALRNLGCGDSAKMHRYRSKYGLFGLPFVSVAFGRNLERGEKYGVAKGWIAVGDVALSPFVGIGNLAVAPLAIGTVAIGVFALAGAGVGPFVVAGLSVGWLACGAFAVGLKYALGIVSLAFTAAIGYVAVAQEWAMGFVKFAAHTNAQEVWTWMQHEPVLTWLLRALPHAGWLSLLGLPGMIVALKQLRTRKP